MTGNDENQLNRNSNLIPLEPDDEQSAKIKKDKEKVSIVLEAHEDFAPIDDTEDANKVDLDKDVDQNEFANVLS